MSGSSNLREIVEREQQRLEQAQTEQAHSQTAKKRRSGIVRCVCVVALLAAVSVISVLIYHQVLSSSVDKYLSDAGSGASGGISLNRYQQEYVRRIVDDRITDYNKGFADYDEVLEQIRLLQECEGPEGFEEEMQISLSRLEGLFVSKLAYEDARESVMLDSYLQAAELFSEVVEEDTNYSDAQKQLSKLSELCVHELEGRIAQDLSEDSTEYLAWLEVVSDLYPDNADIQGLRSALDDCGDPLAYTLSRQIVTHLDDIETDTGLAPGPCTSLALTMLSQTEVIVEANFDEDQTEAHRFAYLVTWEDVERLEREELGSLLYDAGEAQRIQFDWNPGESDAEKLNLLYSQMIRFGTETSEDAGDVEHLLTESPEDVDAEVMDGSSHATEGFLLLKTALLSIGGVVICLLLLRYAIKSLFD